jgi:predicted secreted hydrolase
MALRLAAAGTPAAPGLSSVGARNHTANRAIPRLLLAACMGLLIGGCDQPAAPESGSVTINERMSATPDAGFARAYEPRPFTFPADHGAHPEFATEWWYFTGNLHTDDDVRFGYQLPLFRVGLKPGPAATDSDWRSRQLFMGHLAVSELDRQRHHRSERFSRAAAGLAGATASPLRVWLGPWQVSGSAAPGETFPLQLSASDNGFGIALELSRGDRPIVLQGDRGLSQKGAAAGNASYYYSMTRLPTSGRLLIGDEVFRVSGNSWFDREWSSSALAPDQAGWDWFALQLDDGRDLMFYRMRGVDGHAQRFSKGVIVGADGDVTPLTHDQVELSVQRQWKTADGVRYPLSWRLRVPEHGLDLAVDAAFDDQLMDLTVHYWEGAVVVGGSHSGVGYLELSGYR